MEVQQIQQRSVGQDQSWEHFSLFDFTASVIYRAYGMPAPGWYNTVILLSTVVILGALVGTKSFFGISLIGNTWADIVFAATYAGVVCSMGIMGFGLICAYDFSRRIKTADIFYQALVTPGLDLVLGDTDLSKFCLKSIPQII